MNLKRKYQPGGIVYTPYVATQAGGPQISTSSEETKTKSSNNPEKISGTMKKEIIDLLKENGLPSDVSMFLNAADKFLAKSQSLSNFSLFGGQDDDYSMSDWIKIAQMVNDVKYNNGLRNEAVTHVKNEAAGSEVALTDNGLIYAYNTDGKIVKVKPSDYDPTKYQALSNSQLISLRENNAGLAFQTGILNDLNNSIGMNTLTKQLREIVNSFGSDKIGGYATKDKAVINGMKILMAAGPDGYYQFENEEELRDAKRALRYLYNSMPDNAKNLLRAKTAVEGGDPNDPNDISNLIWQVLQEHTSRTTTVKFDKTATDFDPILGGKKGGSNADKLVQDTYLYRVASLNGPRRQIMIAPKASKIADTGLMVTQGIVNGAVVDKDEKRIGNMSISQFLQKAEAVKAADATTIVFGNRVLKPGEYDNIMFDSNEECNTVLLPYTYDGGKIVPDFDTFDKFNQLQRAISGKFAVPKTEIDRMARELGLDSDKYNYDSETNSLTLTQKMYFLQFGAIASDNALDLTKENERFLEKLDKDEADFYRKDYENMVEYGSIERKKSDMRVGKYKDSWLNRAKFYKGWIWMAMPDAYRGAHLSMNEYIDRDDVNNFGRRTEMRQQQIAVNDAYQQAYGNIGAFRDE